MFLWKIFPLPLIQEEQVVSYWQKNGHFILVNCHWEACPQKSRGRVVPLSISVHGLGGLVNVCEQVSNNNQALGLLREVLSQNLPNLKAATFRW